MARVPACGASFALFVMSALDGAAAGDCNGVDLAPDAQMRIGVKVCVCTTAHIKRQSTWLVSLPSGELQPWCAHVRVVYASTQYKPPECKWKSKKGDQLRISFTASLRRDCSIFEESYYEGVVFQYGKGEVSLPLLRVLLHACEHFTMPNRPMFQLSGA